MSLKDYAKAEEAFRRAISMDRNSLSAYALLGQLFVVQKSYDKAIAEFQNILKMDPKSATTHTILGVVYDSRADVGKAKYHYGEALKLDPGLAVAANNLAWLIAEKGGSLDDALKLAQQAREKLPESANVADTLGWVFYRRAAYRSAIELFEESIKKDAQNAVYHYHLGLSYSKTGDIRKARESLGMAIKLDPRLSTGEVQSILRMQ
jgi:tetratricopeptide (TPR) repeat protein